MAYRAISLFSGAGGLDCGFEAVGFRTVFACERDGDSAGTWVANRQNYKDVMHVDDIENLLGEIASLDDVDVVYGGPPCQGFSIAGKMDVDDSRNELVMRFIEVVETIRPKVFVMENVKNLAVSPKWKFVRDRLVGVAERAGYETAFMVYNAAMFGVSENRSRLLFVGVNPEIGSICSFKEKLEGQKKSPNRVRDVLKAVGRYDTSANPKTCTAEIRVAKTPVLRKSAYSGMLVNGAGRPIKLDGLSQTLTASMGGNNTPIIDQLALEDEDRRHWFESLHEMALAGDEKLPVEVPSYVRRLTTREAAAIQTFPPSYVFVGSSCSQYRQIGNAVPCEFAKAIARAVELAYFDRCDRRNEG